MGSCISKAYSCLFTYPSKKISIIGLDGSGKTSILYRWIDNNFISTIPTIGFNIESLIYSELDLMLFDYTTVLKMQNIVRLYYEGSNGVIFVVDGSDNERFEEFKSFFKEKMLIDEIRSSDSIMILSNKCDIDQSMSVEFIKNELNLADYGREIGIFSVSARSNSGLIDSLDWLSSKLKERH